MAIATLCAPARRATACGCFVMSNAATPVIQAGERILFSRNDGVVTAYIQIQYQGAADQFGWLLPLPSVPTLEVGTDVLFAALQARTDPTLPVTTDAAVCARGGDVIGCGAGAAASSTGCAADGECQITGQPNLYCIRGSCIFVQPSADLGASSPLVVEDSIGPYDFAVLKADDASAMLGWLRDNRFFVPAGTDGALTPYVHPGAYFLALKLRSGRAAGDVQPVVVRYASDLPMIPIVLTAVGAVPNMGILVWELGEGRAIPRNYYHTALDWTALDWQRVLGGNAGAAYNDLFQRAIDEGPGHHTFVTEYAGPSSVMDGALAAPPIDRATLARVSDVVEYVDALAALPGSLGAVPASLVGVLREHIAEPKELVAEGVPEASFYGALVPILHWWRARYPEARLAFDAQATTDDLMTRVVEPLQRALTLLGGHPYLTRLHTTLSPVDMTADPVFSENAALPAVSNRHAFTASQDCQGGVTVTGDDLEGGRIVLRQGQPEANYQGLPASRRIEALRDSGPSEVVVDNAGVIVHLSPGGGCRVPGSPAARGSLALLALCMLGLRAGTRWRRG